MAERNEGTVIPPSSGKGAGGGMFKNLTPKQKKYALVVGAAAVLALIALLSRRGAAEPEAPEENSELEAREAFGVPVAAGATDPTAFLGAQSEDVTSALSDVSTALGGVGGGLEGLGEDVDDLAREGFDFRSEYMDREDSAAGSRDRIEGGVNEGNRQLEGLTRMARQQREREKRRGQKARERKAKKQQRRGGGGRKPSTRPPRKPKNAGAGGGRKTRGKRKGKRR